MCHAVEDTEDLLGRAEQGDRSAINHLLSRYRGQLQHLVTRRLDRRMVARLDPSDVVQDALADAGRRLPDYLRDRPLVFIDWLRRLTLQRLTWYRRTHVESRKRSVSRECDPVPSPAGSRLNGLIASGTSPSEHAIRNEEHTHLRLTLASLSTTDREILILRYDERLAFGEIARRLGIGVGATHMRHLRAIEHLHEALTGRS